MKLAEGAIMWILFPLILLLLSIVGFVSTSNTVQSIFLFLVVVFFLIEGLFIIFFRDPERIPGKDFVAVADGKIQRIQDIYDKDIGDSICISTFMNLHNVHVNRIPFDGTIKKITHIDGGYLPAFRKESDQNERVITLIESSFGTFKIIQIAGTLAKRIVCYKKENDHCIKGQRFGMIKLGSRVDVILPKQSINTIQVTIDNRVIAGVDTICIIQ